MRPVPAFCQHKFSQLIRFSTLVGRSIYSLEMPKMFWVKVVLNPLAFWEPFELQEVAVPRTGDSDSDLNSWNSGRSLSRQVRSGTNRFSCFRLARLRYHVIVRQVFRGLPPPSLKASTYKFHRLALQHGPLV